MMKKTMIATMAIAAGLLLVAASCTRTPAPAENGDGGKTVTTDIKLATNDQVGEYFTDANGMALYIFTKDTATTSVCFGGCLVAWPVFYKADIKVPASLNKADFGEITRTDGVKQSTYMGWPIYYYIQDKNPGDIAGEGVGNVWYVVKSDYSALFSTDTANYLVDPEGMTLYYFTNDSKDKSVCEGQCLVNWPEFYGGPEVTVPTTIVAKADFGEITRTDGKKQTTYKGRPLYYYIGDEARGDKKGQGLNNVWFIVDPATVTAAQ